MPLLLGARFSGNVETAETSCFDSVASTRIIGEIALSESKLIVQSHDRRLYIEDEMVGQNTQKLRKERLVSDVVIAVDQDAIAL